MLQKWFQGEVIKGYKKARETGYPTANIALRGDQIFRPGVYAGFVGIQEQIYRAAIVIGVEAGKVEAFIFDMNANLYNQDIQFWIEKKIGEIVYFDTEESLQSKIEEDVQNIREFLKAIKKPSLLA